MEMPAQLILAVLDKASWVMQTRMKARFRLLLIAGVGFLSSWPGPNGMLLMSSDIVAAEKGSWMLTEWRRSSNDFG